MFGLDELIEPHSSWIKLQKSDYEKYGVVEVPEAKVITSYKIGKLKNNLNTLTIYNYGNNKNFINDLANSYKDLQINFEMQDEYGVFPVYWQNFESNFLSVIKLINNPKLNIVDIFFVYKNILYCAHTYLKNKEINFSVNNLCSKYPNIRHIIDEINKLQN